MLRVGKLVFRVGKLVLRGPVVWIPMGSPKMKGECYLGVIPI